MCLGHAHPHDTGADDAHKFDIQDSTSTNYCGVSVSTASAFASTASHVKNIG